MSGLLLGMVLSVCTCFGTCSYKCFCPTVPLFPYICCSAVVLTLYRIFLFIILNRISHFSASAGKHSPILGYVINRIRLGGLIYNLKSFLQLNMFQELQIFCIYMYVFGCRLSLFRLCDNDIGITAVDVITNGIT
jgi:hypothetical protein